MWKRALLTVVLVIAVGPALASDVEQGTLLAAVTIPAKSVSSVSHAMIDARAPTCGQQEHRAGEQQQHRATVERERKAEFLRHVWNAP